jgi:bifunctional UDP-N-acetylglucosamine pyrophosphorylase/glucosamine-1-phosphate N-acetyltransferase
MKDTKAIVLAAGKGTRMGSDLPKVLVEVCGKPIIEWIVETLEKVPVTEIILIVSNENRSKIERVLGDRCRYIVQKEQLGTAHAVRQAKDYLSEYTGNTLVMVGDAPAISREYLRELINRSEQNKSVCTFLTVKIAENKPPWGRILRSQGGDVTAIVEDKDASEEEKALDEMSSSHFIFDNKSLFTALEKIGNENAQHESSLRRELWKQ